MKLDRAKYPESALGNFFVKDTVGVPHPYCITAKHVEIAADQFAGMLGDAAIEAAERKGAKCGICRGKLTYKQHETALLIGCRADHTTNEAVRAELETYLKSIVGQCQQDGYAGFAFVKEAT